MANIKDVARLAGVGLGTASRVVSGKGSVSPATLERVKKAIAELDFRPSHAARSLLSGTSQMIGVYIPVLKGTFYTPILQSIDTALRAAGLHMVVAFGVGSGDARRQAIEGIDFLMERGCDGLILLTNLLTDDDIAALGPKQSRVVVLGHSHESIPEQCFSADHTEGGRAAARALLEHRHRKIAVIAGPSSSPDNVERIAGFMDELERNGIATDKMWVAESDFSPQGGWDAAAELVASGHKFTALFCANDEMAVGALSYFQDVGLSVPGDVSVLGYDDTPSAQFSAPRLTSVHIPWRDVTLNGLNALLNRCYGSRHPVQREFAISVTVRASLGKPARRRAE
ncbi:LacI family DNA-binding transcriptional regulator [Massilia violaceinigra]|uniref:LacI family DNA-binding transcriptional regulator n=1 Tax=Massilia violaceinigra TaxID=2045208 RepID=A0ABY4AF92_9BURK|nr:LacI family DNA-binding transcriptional regulator [Massilia violaceinigra]UOD32820.1 LacI family DNA-binding transcriptional regulator [Massilia violaceinigra]